MMKLRATLFAVAIALVFGSAADARNSGQGPFQHATPTVWASWSVPFIYPSSGSFANNGALTMTTALDQTYPQAYIYAKAAAIAGGSTAGWYYATCSSGTACTLFNNAYVSGQPLVPASPTAFAVTGAGAYTQTTASPITAYTLSLTGGVLGAYDSVSLEMLVSMNNTVGTKAIIASYSTCNFLAPTAFASIAATEIEGGFANTGTVSTQTPISPGSGLFGSGTSPTICAINSGNAQTLSVSVNENTATDYTILRYGALSWVPASAY